MVVCAAADCPVNQDSKEDGEKITLHRWPKDVRTAKIWTKWVKVRRLESDKTKEWTPTPTASLCQVRAKLVGCVIVLMVRHSLLLS